MARGRSQTVPETVPGVVPEPAPKRVPEAAPSARPRPARALPPRTSRRRGVLVPEAIFAAELEAGELPSIRAVKRRMKVGQDKAKTIRDQLAALVQTRMSEPAETIEVTA